MQAEPGSFKLKNLALRLKSLQFKAARDLLHLWIRPTVLGGNAAHLGLAQDELICYVLPSRSISDLLILDTACKTAKLPRPTHPLSSLQHCSGQSLEQPLEERSFFFLGHAEGTLGRKTQRAHSTRMQRLVQHQITLPQAIKIIPVSLYWGHQPDKEKSIFKIILSENWTVTSRFKKILAGLFHPKHILVQFSKPINLAELIESEGDPEIQKRKLLRILRVHFNRQKKAIIGPDLSHRHTLIKSIMASHKVKQAIDQAVSQHMNDQALNNKALNNKALNNKATNNQATNSQSIKNKALSHYAAEKKNIEQEAMAYVNEIAADQSYRVIRFFLIVLTWLWHKLYDGIEVSHIDIVKDLARSHEIIYIPCHRSHIDYLLLSYVLYKNGLTPPHIAAGKNLNLPIVGALLRRGGAFFMRRSFKDNPLYKTIFDEYLHLVFTRGYSVEYFIEGGRSRTGRTLTPRIGMLNMTIGSFQRDPTTPIIFLPVYFGYERVLEASTYLGELTGKAKTDESVFDLLGIFRIFKHSFGKVSVNFGQALPLGDFLERQLPGSATASVAAADLTKATLTLANELATRINDAAAVNPINLVATAILCTPKQTISLHRLEHQVKVLQTIANKNQTSGHTTVTPLDASAIISHALKVTGIERIVTQDFGDIIKAPGRNAILLTYYANNTLHIFALASLIARIVFIENSCSQRRLVDACLVLQPYLKAELFLNYTFEETEQRCQRTLQDLESLGLLTIKGEQISAPAPSTDHYASLSDLAEIIEPSLERFYIVSALILENKKQSLVDLEIAASGIAQLLSTIYGINSPEFFDKSLFTKFIATLTAEASISTTNNIITKTKKFDIVKQNTEDFLEMHVRYNIAQAIQQLNARPKQPL